MPEAYWCKRMESMRKLIKNGVIYDGSGRKPYTANIVIEDNRISAITCSGDLDADVIIDAKMRAVTPGFIDSHRHCDISAIVDKDFGNIELAQGITTTISGNCGLTPFPTTESSRQQMYDFIEPCLGKAPEWMKFSGFPDYIAKLEATAPYINVGGMIGTGAVKVAAKGFEKTPFTRSQMDSAKGYLKEAMETGAFGISAGIMYVPECYSTTKEFIELISQAARYNTILTCHIRGEGDSLVSSVEEILNISRQAEIPLNISHFKAVGIKNWHKTVLEAMEKIENARASGQDVSVDFYPYTGGSTILMTLIPPVIQGTDLNETLMTLSTTEGVERLKREIYRQHKGWDNMVLSIGWDRIIISSVTKESNKRFQGMNVSDITELLGYSDAVDFICELLVDEQAKVGIIAMSMDQDDVDIIAKLPYSMVISDSLYGSLDSPHPRLYGSFTRIIRDYVMERKILSLETAINKMTHMTAERFKISNRGALAVGNYADINIFDPAKMVDKATFSNPNQLSSGMDMVLINGEIIWKDNERTGISNARVLKRR